MAEKVLLNTPHVLSALSPANSRYSRPCSRPLRASGRLLRLAAEGDLVAPWRCSCASRMQTSFTLDGLRDGVLFDQQSADVLLVRLGHRLKGGDAFRRVVHLLLDGIGLGHTIRGRVRYAAQAEPRNWRRWA